MTRDQKQASIWTVRFKRALMWMVATLLTLSLILWIVSEADNYRTFRRDLIEFRGASIGSSMAEVRYAFGVPKQVFGPPPPNDGFPALKNGYLMVYDVEASSGPNQLPAGRRVDQYNIWSWDTGDTSRTDVTFDPKSKRVVQISCNLGDPGPSTDCYSVGGLHAGMTEQEAISLIGQPDTSSYDGVTKMMVWKAIGIQLFLTKREVYQVGKSPAGDADLWWWLKHGRP